MKSTYSLITLIALLINFKSFSQTYKGVVIDSKTKQAVPYVNIGIPSKGFGIISNESGGFNFKLTTEKDSDVVQVYSIGYKPFYFTIKQLKANGEKNPFSIALAEVSMELATVTIRPNEYDTKIVGGKNANDFKCEQKMNLSLGEKDSTTKAIEKEKGISEKSVGTELGNKIKIDKGQQTFVDKIRFKTCLKPNDTCIYRLNIYTEGATIEKHMTPFGMVKIVSTNNIMKTPVITKVIGVTEVQEIDVSSQNIEVTDDFIIAIECIYSSNKDMNLAMNVSMFGATNLLIRGSTMEEWVKVPLIDVTFVSATVTYKKKKGFFERLFN